MLSVIWGGAMLRATNFKGVKQVKSLMQKSKARA
jgi:hypothetical protein